MRFLLPIFLFVSVACGLPSQFDATQENSELAKIAVHAAEGTHPRILVVSHSTLDVKYALLGSENHQEYAAKQGYDYQFRNGLIDNGTYRDPNISNKVLQLGIYWQKIEAVEQALALQQNGVRAYDWVMWVDADAIFTNMNIRVQDILDEYADSSDVNLIISTDNLIAIHDQVNSGIFLVRNNAWSKEFFHRVRLLYSRYKDMRTPEQQAIQDMIYGYVAFNQSDEITVTKLEHRNYDDARISKSVKVIPQRKINAFFSNSFVPSESVWQPGDFILHFASSRNKLTDLNYIISCLKEKGTASPDCHF